MASSPSFEALRRTIPGCELLAYIDLGSAIVLASNGSRDIQQERLDALAVTAQDSLNGVAAQRTTSQLGGSTIAQTIIMIPGETNLFIRSRNDVQDALCCICVGQHDIADICKQAGAVLSVMESDPAV